MKQVLVIGAGLVGRTIALDLARRYSVTAVDMSEKSINRLADMSAHMQRPVATVLGNINELDHHPRQYDLVINALPGFAGYQTLERIISCGKNVVDISFFAEDPFTLDDLAKKNGVIAVVDCGVAPGLCNMMLGDGVKRGNVNTYECYVGGLPKVRTAPWEYKAPYSPADVIEFYLRPARLVVNGEIVTYPALTELEAYDSPVGTLEAFNTDGLRSLLRLADIVPNMKEKTLRYPGYASKILMLQKSGFFDTDVIRIDGHNVSPLDVTSAILRESWTLAPGESEFTFMQVRIDDKTYTIFDEGSPEFSSMSRATGFTCNAVATAMLEGTLNAPAGIVTPEEIGLNGNLGIVLDYLDERGVACL
jgi:lysine 6-dehydrogenase